MDDFKKKLGVLFLKVRTPKSWYNAEFQLHVNHVIFLPCQQNTKTIVTISDCILFTNLYL